MADGTITIDGRAVPFEKGDTIIRAAKRAGIDIPHYCWHPGLSAPANCRMCLVEVGPPPGRPAMQLPVLNWDPETKAYTPTTKLKLFPACQMGCKDGLEVKSETSEEVTQTRKAVQELLLLNHPVDCPICDQAGECDLQDYWLEHMRDGKRMAQEPIHKPKAVVFGPTIVYDAERCIMCTRCIRVSDEVAKDPVLDMRQRGNRNEITVSPGRELDHEYTLMTEHVCPVGALTSSHFRFKARVWFLRSAPSVCQGCATGCNAYLDYDPRDNKPYRYRPRDNEEVNKYWMCDEGMLSYPEAYENRRTSAHVGHDDATIGEALDAAKNQLKGHRNDVGRLAIVLSAQHSNEDNFALAYAASKVIGASRYYLAAKPAGQSDDILMDADKNPNRNGVKAVAKLLAIPKVATIDTLIDDIEGGEIDYVIALGSAVDADEVATRQALTSLKGVVSIGVHGGVLDTAAHISLPATSWAETRGTYVNKDGIAQEAHEVLEINGDAYPGWQLAVALTRKLGYELAWTSRQDLDRAMLEAAAPAEAPGAAQTKVSDADPNGGATEASS